MSGLGIPQLSLVVLVGVSGSGKSTFAARHFAPTEVLSSDFCRGLLADDENDQTVTAEAFALLRHIAALRLRAGRLTVVDATNVQPQDRRQFVELAREHDVLPVAIVLDVPERTAVVRNAERADRTFGAEVIRRQHDRLRRGLRGLRREGFRTVHVLHGDDEVDQASIVRTRSFNDRRDLTGPFDVIGDVHGCRRELEALLADLGYAVTRDDQGRAVGAHHPGRTAVFVGDLVDRGPDVPGVLRLVMGMVAAGDALSVAGNHEDKLLRAIRGRKVQVAHGLAESLEQLAAQPEGFRAEVERFLHGLVAHFVLDDGRLVVAHAGLLEQYQGRASARVRSFCLYGQTTGETDEYGLPVRQPWAEDYRGAATVVYGHTPTTSPEWVNRTICVDTGCVFGGRLTAVRYPERDLVSVPAAQVYADPVRPLAAPRAPEGSAEAAARDPAVLAIGDVQGARVIETRFDRRIGVREENAAAALEVMSRFAVDPRWLLYLPPTMSPAATSAQGDVLEHPDQAFDAYRDEGVAAVLCEEKHMGSRAVVLVCRSLDAARARFGAPGDGLGEVWTRTGRAFFAPPLAARLVDRVRAAAEEAGLFDELDTSWLLLDAELLPWSAKAGDLIRDRYAATGAAARTALAPALAALHAAAAVGRDVGPLLERTARRADDAEAFTAAYRRYAGHVDGLDGVTLAPFQVLASQGRTHQDRPHAWHLAAADRLHAADPRLFTRTARIEVDPADAGSRAAGVAWWTDLTASGGEGMVVKPAANLGEGRRGLLQPGLKVRGADDLRLVYGPDYLQPANLARLRDRSLGHKRSLAIREYTLGLEALERAAAGEPLWRVHECVFAVLALESEPVDPRL